MSVCKKGCKNCSCEYCYQRSFACHPRSKDLADKSLDATKIPVTSKEKYLFNCDKCPHQFASAISNVVGLSRWCPYCCVPSSKLCENRNCESCFNRSFASHEKSKYLVDKSIDPRMIVKGSSTKYNFTCDVCMHEIKLSICHVTKCNKASWCGYCSSPPKYLCDCETCETCFAKSFASHPKSQYLLDKSIDPRKIFIQSERKYDFKCDVCAHVFNKSIYNITSKNNPSWCMYCTNQGLCDDMNCTGCFEKSFASHEKSRFLVDKSIDARKIFKGSSKKHLFQCDDCSAQFSTTLSHVTSRTDPRWCPFCQNKTEKVLYDFITANYTDAIHQFSVDWCKNKKHLRFDICIQSLKIIIELDGRQHFHQVRNWQDPTERQKTDIYKMKCAIDNGYSVIRLLQEEVWYNKIDWQNALKTYVKQYEKPVIIFIEHNDMYSVYNVDELREYIITTN